MSAGAILFALFIVGLVVVVWAVGAHDDRQRRRAIEGGCICAMGPFVEWIRSDCPYHATLGK